MSRDRLVVRRLLLATVAAVLVTMLPSSVSASDDEVRRSGPCSHTGEWELRAKWDDEERIELRGRVENTRAGQAWTWKIKHNGSISAQGRAVTGSGGFDVRRALVDLPGVDHCVFRAERVRTGEVCRGRIDW